MKRIFPILVIFALAACAAPTQTQTSEVFETSEVSTLTPTPTQTLPPTATPTETLTPTPTPLPIPPEARTLVEQGAVYDDEKKLAYDPSTGRVLGWEDLNGEWHDFGEGFVEIPANVPDIPPLRVPIYRTIEDALWAEKDRMAWNDDMGVRRYRPEQEAKMREETDIYWTPFRESNMTEIEDHFYSFVSLKSTKDPSNTLSIDVLSNLCLSKNDLEVARIIFRSKSTNYLKATFFVVGNDEEIYNALMNGEIYIPGPGEAREDFVPTATPTP
ncbi:MAG: hypothetical protein LC099_09895 [Anaerolineales bacterium]|nr:hypothetical protein [Anaerolineales bacterium]